MSRTQRTNIWLNQKSFGSFEIHHLKMPYFNKTFLQQTVFKMYVDKNYGLERRNHVNNEQLLDN